MAVWVIWLIAAGVLLIAEALSLDLVLIMCGGGAGAAALTAALGAPIPVQLAVFALVSVGLLGVVRPLAVRHLRLTAHTSATGVDALVGRNAVVVQTVNEHAGRVKIGGDEWSAQSYDPGQVLETGQTVRVMEIRGVTAVVWGEP